MLYCLQIVHSPNKTRPKRRHTGVTTRSILPELRRDFPNLYSMSHDKKMLDREAVRSVIQQWNANRLDLFALSEPDEVSYFMNK